MSDNDQQRIRERAYALWESLGRPHGREEEHWHQARQELAQEQDAGRPPAPAAVPKARKKPAAATAPKAPAKRRATKA